MDPSAQFDNLNENRILELAERFAGPYFDNNLEVVLKTAFKDNRNLPSLGFKKTQIIPIEEYIEKWVKKYLKGYKNRPSQRQGSRSNTFPDPIIKLIMKTRLPDITEDLAIKIQGGHQLMMTIENIVGELLEEYLSIELAEDGWYCCWGSTIDAVDFCKENGELLQVKNSDNSENSSSVRVRAGTKIQKWHRRVSTRYHVFCWESLQNYTSRCDITEEDFRRFAIKTIQDNPDCIYVPIDHPLNQ